MTTDIGSTTDEWLSILLSRRLQDEEFGILGTRSEVAQTACSIAQQLHAPGLWYMSGPSGVVNPRRIGPIASYELFDGAEAHQELTDNIDLIDWSHLRFDFAVLGGLQVDQYGNLNTVSVGPWHQPVIRGPGAIGASVLAAHADHFFILMPTHNPRVFVPDVDFISAAGFGRGGHGRDEAALPGGGPVELISPLGVFDFCEETRRMRIRSLHPGVTLDDVRGRTGFELVQDSADVETTPPPTAAERRVLAGLEEVPEDR